MVMRNQDSITSLKSIEFDNLPLPAIMEKLEKVNPDLGHKVLDRVEAYQRHRDDTRRYVDEQSVGHQLRKCFARASDFMREKLHIAPKQNGNIRGNEDNFQFDRASMGMDIRHAISHIMLEHYVSQLALLTPQEQNSLKISPK